MSSLVHCFAAIAGSIGEKIKMDITRPPLKGYLREDTHKKVIFLVVGPLRG